MVIPEDVATLLLKHINIAGLTNIDSWTWIQYLTPSINLQCMHCAGVAWTVYLVDSLHQPGWKNCPCRIHRPHKSPRNTTVKQNGITQKLAAVRELLLTGESKSRGPHFEEPTNLL